MATTSNISSAWTPAANLGHEIGNVLQVQGFRQLGDCCEKCGPMGLSFAVFPGFLLYIIISSTFSERCLYSKCNVIKLDHTEIHRSQASRSLVLSQCVVQLA